MNYADVLEKWFDDGMTDLWRNVRAMPEDKLDWKPAETARSAREVMEEIVHVIPFNAALVKTFKAPEGDWDMPKDKKSIDELETSMKASVKDFIAAVREFPDEKFDEMVDMGWMKMSFSQIIAYPYWNMMYHLGQIEYIQTMYGDKEMH